MFDIDRRSAFLALVFTLLLGSTSTARGETPGDLSAADWHGLREAYEANRHEVTPVEGGYEACNPGQRWRTRFDRRGFDVCPDASDWSWGLELESWGRAGHPLEVAAPLAVSVEGGRIAYAWSASLEEWYVNDPRGLEHGFTVHSPPAPRDVAEQRLVMTFRVRGGLHPRVDDDRGGVRFLDDADRSVLTYRGLCAYDADGRDLVAGFEVVGDRLRLSVDEDGARYPVTIDPIAQQAYLKASNTDANDEFGYSVTVSQNTVAIGAIGESSGATVINGNQNNDSANDAGAVYVFVRRGDSWNQQAYIKASNTNAGDYFGLSVALSGDTLVVGAPYEDSNATGLNGAQANNSKSKSGAAYVFVRDGDTWQQQAYVKASNTDTSDRFGWCVAIDGDAMAIGAPYEASAGSGLGADETDNGAYKAGAVYLFERDAGAWSQELYVKPNNAAYGDQFGGSVSLSGGRLVVGAEFEDSNAKGVNGNANNNSAPSAGAAFVYVRIAGQWRQQAYLKASNTEASDYFGTSVAVSGDVIVVGADGEDSSATGVNGNQTNNYTTRAGAAYVFVRESGFWSQQAYLKGQNTSAYDYFGASVAVSGDVVVVGAPEFGVGDAGAVCVFRKTATTWVVQSMLTASNAGTDDTFGSGVAVADDLLVIGAPRENSNATGVDGDQDNNTANDAGAAYVFGLPELGVPFCFGDPGSGTPCPCGNDNNGAVPGSGCASGLFPQGAKLSVLGYPSVGTDDLVLIATRAEPNNSGLFFQANGRVNGGDGVVFGDGLRCIGGGEARLEVRMTNGIGTSITTVPIAARGGVSPGDTRYYQYWYRTIVEPPCGSGVNEFNLSNGIQISWQP